MDRHEEGGAPERQPPEEVQLYQRLNDNRLLEAALSYAKRGWPVLPLYSLHNGECTCGAANCQSPGKHPRTAQGSRDATTDLEQIKQWWAFWPEANVGIATGAASGLVVLDVDPRNGGKESLERLQEAYGPFNTYTVLSGGDDWHFYFLHPGGHIPCRANLEAGIDVKADGGLVVAPLSVHVSRARYRIEQDVPVAELPRWLQVRLSEARNGAALLPATGALLGQLSVSERIKTLIAEGDQAGEYPSRSEALFAVIRAMIMAGHCDDEISAVLLNPAHAISEKAHEKGSAWLCGEMARARTKAHVNGGHSSTELGPRRAPAHPPLRLLTIAEVKARPKPKWLIEPLIPQNAFCVMFGPSGHGKSFLALDWALSIGSDIASLGHAISPGPVVYVAAEGIAGLGSRIRAWEQAHGCSASNVLFLAQPVDLLNEKTSDAVITAIDQALLEQTLAAKPALIVIDTLARCFAGGDENSSKDATQAIATLDKIRISTGACVLVVHHSTKASGGVERGSGALRGAANTMILVERKHKTITVSVDKQKDAEAAAPICLKLVPYDESCALEAAVANHGGFINKGLNDKASTLLKALSAVGKPLSHKELCLASPSKETTLHRALKELTKMNAIVKGDGRSGKYEITDLGANLLVP